MDNITLLDIFLMHMRSHNPHEINIDILKSMYEHTHNYYIAVFSAVLVLAGGIIGSFIALLYQNATSKNVTAIIMVAFVFLLISLAILAYKINRLQRNYLDIIQIYNLLARYF